MLSLPPRRWPSCGRDTARRDTRNERGVAPGQVLRRGLRAAALIELLRQITAGRRVRAYGGEVGVAAPYPMAPMARIAARRRRGAEAELGGSERREVVRAARVVHVAGVPAHRRATACGTAVVDRIGRIEQRVESRQRGLH